MPRHARAAERRPPFPPPAALAIVALAGILTMAQPTATVGIDPIWCAALAVAGALAAAEARPGPLLVAASVAVVASPDLRSLVPAIVGLGCAIGAAAELRWSGPFLRGAAGASAVCALLVASGTDRPAAWAAAGWLGVAGPLVASAAGQVAPATRRRGAVVLGGVLGVSLLCCLVAGVGAAIARNRLDEGADALERGLEAVKDNDVELAREELLVAAEALADAADGLGRWGIATRIVPGAAQNVDAAVSLLRAGRDASAAAAAAAGVIDNDSLAIEGGRVQLDAVAVVAEPLADLVDVLSRAVDEIEEARQLPLLPPVRDRLERLSPEVDQALHDARVGAAAAEVVPGMLGADRPRRYLVLFTSPAEARGRFGFPAAYAIVVATDGRLELEVAESIDDLQEVEVADQSRMPLDDPQVAPYVDFSAAANWRSVTIPPDFPTVATIARELWRQYGTGEIDGVLRFDTTALGALVELTGPVPIAGRAEPLAGDEVARYLDYEQYLLFADEDVDVRREALEGFAGAVFDQLLERDLPGPRGLVEALGPMVDEGRLDMASYDDDELAFLDLVEMTGRFEPPSTPDAFALGGVNAVGNKIDAFLRRTVDYRATVADDGSIEATMTLELRNDAPASGLPAYVIGSTLEAGPHPPPGTNDTFVLVWSALPLVAADVDGEAIEAASFATVGWYLHVFHLSLAPTSTVTLRLDLAGPPAAPGPYALTVLPGGATSPDVVGAEVTTDGGDPLLELEATEVHTPIEAVGGHR